MKVHFMISGQSDDGITLQSISLYSVIQFISKMKKGVYIFIGMTVGVGVAVGIYFAIRGTSKAETHVLLKTNDGAIKLFNCNSKQIEKTIVENKIYGITGFANYKSSVIFYGTTNPENGILSTPENWLQAQWDTDKWTKTSMTVDYSSEILYVVDGIIGEVYATPIDYFRQKTLLSNLNEPKDIVLDPEMGLMFILQKNMIIQAFMDGSERKAIVKQVNLEILTINTHEKHIYFKSPRSIGVYNYKDGIRLNPIILMENIISMTYMNDRLYYISTTESGNNTLKFCTINDGYCTEDTFMYQDKTLQEVKPYIISGFYETNRCGQQTHCNHFCLLNERHSCVCENYYVLQDDFISCKLSV